MPTDSPSDVRPRSVILSDGRKWMFDGKRWLDEEGDAFMEPYLLTFDGSRRPLSPPELRAIADVLDPPMASLPRVGPSPAVGEHINDGGACSVCAQSWPCDIGQRITLSDGTVWQYVPDAKQPTWYWIHEGVPAVKVHDGRIRHSRTRHTRYDQPFRMLAAGPLTAADHRLIADKISRAARSHPTPSPAERGPWAVITAMVKAYHAAIADGDEPHNAIGIAAEEAGKFARSHPTGLREQVEGSWPNGVHRAFVDGVKWWEFTKTGATLFGSDRNAAEQEAERRYGAVCEDSGTPDARPFAWVLPGDDTARDGGWIDARINRDGEFTKPLYAHPSPEGARDAGADTRDAKRWRAFAWGADLMSIGPRNGFYLSGLIMDGTFVAPSIDEYGDWPVEQHEAAAIRDAKRAASRPPEKPE